MTVVRIAVKNFLRHAAKARPVLNKRFTRELLCFLPLFFDSKCCSDLLVHTGLRILIEVLVQTVMMRCMHATRVEIRIVLSGTLKELFSICLVAELGALIDLLVNSIVVPLVAWFGVEVANVVIVAFRGFGRSHRCSTSRMPAKVKVAHGQSKKCLGCYYRPFQAKLR